MPDGLFAYRDASGAWLSEGRRRLAVARGEGAPRQPLKVLAHQLECSEQHVGRLLRGREQPSAELAARAWIVFGIPGHAWGLAPSGVNLTGSIHHLNSDNQTDKVA